jgi:hypothetical protein
VLLYCQMGRQTSTSPTFDAKLIDWMVLNRTESRGMLVALVYCRTMARPSSR